MMRCLQLPWLIVARLHQNALANAERHSEFRRVHAVAVIVEVASGTGRKIHPESHSWK